MNIRWTTALIASAFFLPIAAAQDTAPPPAELSLPLINQNAWVFTPDVENELIFHKLTGMTCPFELPGTYQLLNIAQPAMGGQSARCTYQNTDKTGFVSLSVNWIREAPTAKILSEHLFSVSEGGQVEGAAPEGEAFQMEFDGSLATDCHRIRFDFTANGVPKHEKIETCQFGKWAFHINQTAPQSDASFPDIREAVANSPSDMAYNLSECIAPTTTPIADISSNTGTTKGDLLFDVLQSQLMLRSIAPDLISKPRLSSSDCLIAYLQTDQDAQLILRDKSSDTLPIRIIQTSLKGVETDRTVWIELATTANDNSASAKTYALIVQSAPGVQNIHRIYENAPPNDEQVIQDAFALFTGKLPVLASLKEVQPGKWTWHIPPDR